MLVGIIPFVIPISFIDPFFEVKAGLGSLMGPIEIAV
jgi:hypothetical protein